MGRENAADDTGGRDRSKTDPEGLGRGAEVRADLFDLDFTLRPFQPRRLSEEIVDDGASASRTDQQKPAATQAGQDRFRHA